MVFLGFRAIFLKKLFGKCSDFVLVIVGFLFLLGQV